MKKLMFAISALVPMINETARHSGGFITLKGDAALADGVIVKKGSDESHVAVTTAATELPLGITKSATDAAEDQVGVELFSAPGTKKGTASANIADGALLCATAAGALVTLPTGAGTYYVIGRALAAAASGTVCEYESNVPYKVVVTAG